MIIGTHNAVRNLYSGISMYGRVVPVVFSEPNIETTKASYPCIEINPTDTIKNNTVESEAYEYSVDTGSSFDVYATPPRRYNLMYEIHTHTAGRYALRDEATLITAILQKVTNYGLLTIDGENYKYDATDFKVVSKGTNVNRTFHQLAMLTVFQQTQFGTPEVLPPVTEDGVAITEVNIN